MTHYPFLFLAAAAAEEVITSAANGFLHTWAPILSPVIVAGISGFWLWWKSRGRNKVDQWQIFMNESQEFREETRKEREVLKTELLAVQIEKKVLLEKLSICEKSSQDSSELVIKYTQQLQVANKEIENLTIRLNALKERVVSETNVNGNGKI